MKDVDFPTRLIGPRDREGLGKRTFLCTRACACASRALRTLYPPEHDVPAPRPPDSAPKPGETEGASALSV